MKKFWRGSILENKNGFRYHWFCIIDAKTKDEAKSKLENIFSNRDIRVTSIDKIEDSMIEKGVMIAGGYTMRVPADDYEEFVK